MNVEREMEASRPVQAAEIIQLHPSKPAAKPAAKPTAVTATVHHRLPSDLPFALLAIVGCIAVISIVLW